MIIETNTLSRESDAGINILLLAIHIVLLGLFRATLDLRVALCESDSPHRRPTHWSKAEAIPLRLALGFPEGVKWSSTCKWAILVALKRTIMPWMAAYSSRVNRMQTRDTSVEQKNLLQVAEFLGRCV